MKRFAGQRLTTGFGLFASVRKADQAGNLVCREDGENNGRSDKRGGRDPRQRADGGVR